MFPTISSTFTGWRSCGPERVSVSLSEAGTQNFMENLFLVRRHFPVSISSSPASHCSLTGNEAVMYEAT